jgi:hypothetical protein
MPPHGTGRHKPHNLILRSLELETSRVPSDAKLTQRTSSLCAFVIVLSRLIVEASAVKKSIRRHTHDSESDENLPQKRMLPSVELLTTTLLSGEKATERAAPVCVAVTISRRLSWVSSATEPPRCTGTNHRRHTLSRGLWANNCCERHHYGDLKCARPGTPQKRWRMPCCR